MRWQTGSEVDLLGFHVYRQSGKKRVRITSRLVVAQGPAAGARYSLLDRRAPRATTIRYWIQAVQVNGYRTWHGPVIVS